MPSLVHDGLLELLHHRPELAFRLARLAGLPVLGRHDHYQPLQRSFVDPSRPEVHFEADLVLAGMLVSAAGRTIVEALDVEAQLGIDPTKFVSFPIYRAGVHSLAQAPAWTLMVSPVPSVLHWAESHLFPREPELRPALAGPRQVSAPLDPGEAREDPEWAILRAVLHARTEHALRAGDVALDAIERIPEPMRSRYRLLLEATRTRTTMHMLPLSHVGMIRMPDVDDELSEFEKEGIVYQSALAEGREEGREEGRAVIREALLELLDSRGLTIDDDARTRITTCRDVARLRTWLRRAAHADGSSHLFEE